MFSGGDIRFPVNASVSVRNIFFRCLATQDVLLFSVFWRSFIRQNKLLVQSRLPFIWLTHRGRICFHKILITSRRIAESSYVIYLSFQAKSWPKRVILHEIIPPVVWSHHSLKRNAQFFFLPPHSLGNQLSNFLVTIIVGCLAFLLANILLLPHLLSVFGLLYWEAVSRFPKMLLFLFVDRVFAQLKVEIVVVEDWLGRYSFLNSVLSRRGLES